MSTSTQDFSGHIPASKSSDEAKLETVENLDHMPTQGTYYDNEEAAHLSNEHRQYLLDRHGTFDLNPMPDNSDADPYNWPTWKVCSVHPRTVIQSHLLIVATESHQPHSRRSPCPDVHIHSRSHHPRLSNHRRGLQHVHPRSQLSHILANRHPRSRSTDLETVFQHLRETASFPAVPRL